jgi:hypothetical protein
MRDVQRGARAAAAVAASPTQGRQRKDGSVTTVPTVRYVDVRGVRRPKTYKTVEEAEFERAKLALDRSRTGTLAAPPERLSLGEFWPTYHADVCPRLQEATIAGYEGVWRRAGKGPEAI